MLPDRLTKIDETTRGDHPFLQPADNYFYFGEYYAYKGYKGGETNQLIFNFKCPPSMAATNPGRIRYKERAINEIADALRKVVKQGHAEAITWVPVPTSKIHGHPDYDDRLLRVLSLAFRGYDVDVRALLRQTRSMDADHSVTARQSADDLLGLLEINRAMFEARPLRNRIVLFDDVLVTGKHFKCCERRLREVIPAEMTIRGLAIARRVLPDLREAFEDLG